MDDIVDNIDALAKRFPLFHVKTMEPDFEKQADVLVQAAVALSEAVHRLRKSRKLSELSDKLIEIHHKESVGDDNHHAAMSRLFAGDSDALRRDEVEGALRPHRGSHRRLRGRGEHAGADRAEERMRRESW